MLTLLVGLASAQSPELTPVLELRPRVEAHTGRDGAAGAEDVFVSQRTRLGVVGTLEKVSASVVVQDVRVWGEEVHTLFDATANRLDVHEGWLRASLGETGALTVGRQEINLHEQRLIGAVGWTQQARAFDAVRVQLGKTGLNGEAAVAILGDPTEAVPPLPLAAAPRPYWEVAIVRAGWAGEEGKAAADLVEVFTANHSDDGDDTNDHTLSTTGVYAKGATGALRGRVEGYAQLGSAGTTTRQAFLVGVAGTVAPDVSVKPEITVWYDLLSGDEDPSDDTSTAFDPMFDTRHKFYGLIDVFAFGAGGPADGRGLHDAALKFGFTPVEKLDTHLDAHLFLAAAPQGGEAVLGQEVDAEANVKAAKGLGVGVGAAVLLRPDLDPDAWGYLQLAAKL